MEMPMMSKLDEGTIVLSVELPDHDSVFVDDRKVEEIEIPLTYVSVEGAEADGTTPGWRMERKVIPSVEEQNPRFTGMLERLPDAGWGEAELPVLVALIVGEWAGRLSALVP
jgi:hypothetical protein